MPLDGVGVLLWMILLGLASWIAFGDPLHLGLTPW
jgi:type IV secretory pathway TrbD component